ncbi:DUF2190 family protein [Marinobacter sp. KMM 10035]|uniref:DUF2190 family protein n=1 Tax=Marinobacter sp. KMM 10035 TaxID=3134034 RepID=UPI00397D35F3
MATNFVQPGQVLTLTAPAGGVTSGSGHLIGAMFVVALHSAAVGESFEGQLTGVWSLPKTSAQAWTEGVAIYWDGSKATTADASGSNALIGHAAAAAANPSATGLVRLSA